MFEIISFIFTYFYERVMFRCKFTHSVTFVLIVLIWDFLETDKTVATKSLLHMFYANSNMSPAHSLAHGQKKQTLPLYIKLQSVELQTSYVQLASDKHCSSDTANALEAFRDLALIPVLNIGFIFQFWKYMNLQ